MYCWESAFLKKIIKFRKLEIDQIRRRNTVAFITQRFLMASGKFIGIFTFLYYFSVTSVRDFRSSDIFVVQSFVEDLNWNLGVLFWAVFSFSEVLVEDYLSKCTSWDSSSWDKGTSHIVHFFLTI